MRIVPTVNHLAAARRAVAGAEAHLPILAAAAVAFAGQMAFARVVLLWPFLGQVLYAAGVELFGYGMARLAARVRREGDKGVVAMTAAWLFSVYAGACNYWHNSPSWSPTPASVSLGVASVAGLASFFVHERYAVRRARLSAGLPAKVTKHTPRAYAAAVTDAPSPAVASPVTASTFSDALFAEQERRAHANLAADAVEFDAAVAKRVEAVELPSPAVAAAVAAPAKPVATTSRIDDGPSRSELARCYLDEQRIAGRLDKVTGPEVMEATGLGQSRAREVLRVFREKAAA